MCCAAAKDEEADQDGPEARPEARVVVACASPGWETIAEEMVISFSSRALQDIGNDAESRVAIAGCLDCFLDLGFAWGLIGVHSWLVLVSEDGFLLLDVVLRDESLFRFVRVYEARFLAVGFGDVFLRGRGSNAEETVECGVWTFSAFDLVFEAKDFMIWPLAINTACSQSRGENAPESGRAYRQG